MGADSRRYQAFISYSHSDQQWAEWLQKTLERFRVPRRLKKRRSELPDRLYPVFRDQTELASGQSLTDAIIEALAASERLIVICSPAAAKSKWVNQEILRFREQAPDRPVFCLLVDGSPDPSSPDCGFPPALLASSEGQPLSEPLAADPRPQADGKTGARYMIIAGILGVGVDHLRQRDAQRRHRLWGAFGVAGFTLAAVMSLLAWQATQAREESELRRAQAERLIEFMLVDLRDQLEPIGRLGILDSVGQQAMAYFQNLGSLGTADERLSRAMALRQIGEVRVGQGQLDEAILAFEDSRNLISGLVEAHPESAEYLFESGQSEFWVGYVYWERSQFTQALDAMQRYQQVSLKLNRLWPDVPDYRMELTYSDQNLAALYLELDDNETAFKHIRSAVENQRQLVAGNPDNVEYVMELANALSWMGSALRVRWQLQESVLVFQEARDYLWKANEHNNDTTITAALCDSMLMLAGGQLLVGEYRLADEEAQKAHELYRQLINSDPVNVLWQEGLARALLDLGSAKAAQGIAVDAAAHFNEARDILRSLVDGDPSNTTFSLRLAVAQALFARSLAQAGETVRAAEEVKVARSLSGEWGNTAATGLSQSLRLAIMWDAIGAVEYAAGRVDDANSAWAAGLTALQQVSLDSLANQAMYVRLLHRLGRAEEAGEFAKKIESSGLRYSGYLPVDPN